MKKLFSDYRDVYGPFSPFRPKNHFGPKTPEFRIGMGKIRNGDFLWKMNRGS